MGNDNFSASTTVDTLIDSLDSTFDHGQQLGILQKIDAPVWEDASGPPPHQFPAVAAINDNVTGVAPSPFSPNLPWNVWDRPPVVK